MNEIELLKELVTIPSLSGEETDAASFLVDRMRESGLKAFIDKAGNAVGIRAYADENNRITKEIVLLGHLDTVPGDIPVYIDGDTLYGRGSVDAKGPLAAFVIAATRAELTPGTRLVVIGAVEEESATSKGARYASANYQPDFCIIGEPSGWDGVTLGYKGRILIDYELKQPMGHTAGKVQGPAETAVAWWNDLNQIVSEHNREHERLFNQLLPSLRQMSSSSDGLINSASLKVGIRLPPDFNIEEFTAKLNALAGDASLQFYAYEPAYQSTRRSALARTFNQVLRQAGVKPRFKLKTGTSDMNVVGPVWNCPIVAYGPGDSTLDHTPNEHIDLGEYQKAVQVLEEILFNLSSI